MLYVGKLQTHTSEEPNNWIIFGCMLFLILLIPLMAPSYILTTMFSAFDSIVIFHFVVANRKILNWLQIFILGLVFDILSGNLLGLSSFSLILVSRLYLLIEDKLLLDCHKSLNLTLVNYTIFTISNLLVKIIVVWALGDRLAMNVLHISPSALALTLSGSIVLYGLFFMPFNLLYHKFCRS